MALENYHPVSSSYAPATSAVKSDVAVEPRSPSTAILAKNADPPKHSLRFRVVLAASAIALGGLTFLLTQSWPTRNQMSFKDKVSPVARPTLAPLSGESDTEAAIRFYRGRVQRDPEETRSQNALAEFYLREVRESGNEDYLPLALEAARFSLGTVPAERNIGGLTAQAHAEFANHDFAAARDDALKLIALDPHKSEPYAILGDARLELGDYAGAIEAFAQMERLGPDDPGTKIRLARVAFLQGETDQARDHFSAALARTLRVPNSPPETVAWCHWQLGETAFATGDYQSGERFYRAALTTAPNDFRALASMGRLRAAHGDLSGAIVLYEQAARIVLIADSMAALGDLYSLSGRTKDAAARYDLMEQLGEHSRKVHNSPYNRNLALFYANHDLKREEAYDLAQGEYVSGRRDIYGADTLAWTALKAGRVAEAQVAMKEALRLGTLDAKLFYHAGIIACAAGDKRAALENLKRALALNSGFDPLQSVAARRALEELEP